MAAPSQPIGASLVQNLAQSAGNLYRGEIQPALANLGQNISSTAHEIGAVVHARIMQVKWFFYILFALVALAFLFSLLSWINTNKIWGALASRPDLFDIPVSGPGWGVGCPRPQPIVPVS